MPKGVLQLQIIEDRLVTFGKRTLKDELSRIEQFGWMGLDSNFNTFNPSVTSKDFTPRDEDYIRVPFRLLSAGIVAGETWRATDFSRGDVLRDSQELLVGVPIYIEHADEIGNEHGVIESVEWQESHVSAEGLLIPAGIVGMLKVDAKSNTKTARNLLSDPPAIFSVSVSVDYQWEPSHQFDSMHEFEDSIGSFNEDGEMIRRMATDIRAYYEASLVSLGADPYAKQIINSKVYKPDQVRSYNSSLQLDRRSYGTTGNLTAQFSRSMESFRLRGEKDRKFKKPQTENPTEMNDKLLLALITLAGFATVEAFCTEFKITEENLTDEKVKGVIQYMKVSDFTAMKSKADGNKSEDTEKLELKIEKQRETIVDLNKEKEDNAEAVESSKLSLSITDSALKIAEMTKEDLAKTGGVDVLEAKIMDFKKGHDEHMEYVVKLRTEVAKLAQLSAKKDNLQLDKEVLAKIEECTDTKELHTYGKMYGSKTVGLFRIVKGADGKEVLRNSLEVYQGEEEVVVPSAPEGQSEWSEKLGQRHMNSNKVGA